MMVSYCHTYMCLGLHTTLTMEAFSGVLLYALNCWHGFLWKAFCSTVFLVRHIYAFKMLVAFSVLSFCSTWLIHSEAVSCVFSELIQFQELNYPGFGL